MVRVSVPATSRQSSFNIKSKSEVGKNVMAGNSSCSPVTTLCQFQRGVGEVCALLRAV